MGADIQPGEFDLSDKVWSNFKQWKLEDKYVRKKSRKEISLKKKRAMETHSREQSELVAAMQMEQETK